MGSLTLDQMRRSAYRLLNTIQSSALSSMPEKHNFASNLSIQSTTLPDAKIGFEYSESKVNPLIAAGGKGSLLLLPGCCGFPGAIARGHHAAAERSVNRHSRRWDGGKLRH